MLCQRSAANADASAANAEMPLPMPMPVPVPVRASASLDASHDATMPLGQIERVSEERDASPLWTLTVTRMFILHLSLPFA